MTEIKIERFRHLNGYRLMYRPNHHKAMTSNNWRGFVYEHMVIAEECLGRMLRDDEVVHHLDSDRANNRSENLTVLPKSMHAKLHKWLDNCVVLKETEYVKRVNSGKSKAEEQYKFCLICKKTLQGKQKKFCSMRCTGYSQRKISRPAREILQSDLSKLSIVLLGKKYGVSDDAIRRWAKAYNLL